MKHLITLFICLASVFHVNAQSLSLVDVDASGFPAMKAKFYSFDAAGNQVRPSAAELTLTENGQPIVITSVKCPPASPPIALSSVLTVDVSGSMIDGSGGTKRIDLAKAAARAWIQGLPVGLSECALTSFDDMNYLNQDFTTDRTKVLNALSTLAPNGGTNYNQGLLEPLAGSLQITQRALYKRVVVFVSDGLPNFEPSTSAIIAEAKRQNCVIFAVTLGLNCPQSLKDISSQTGGLWFENVTTTQEAEAVYRRILQLSQGTTSCEITWNSELTCSATQTDLELRWQGLKATARYSKPTNAIASLSVSPAFVAFGRQQVATQKDKILTLTARNADCNVLGINRKFGSPDFTIVNQTFPLFIQKNTSATITLRFTPSDSAIQQVSFEILTDRCNASFSGSGGFPTKKSSKPTIKLTHPNGGEVFVAGSDTVITWDGIAPSAVVQLDYSIDNGISWKTITTSAKDLQYVWKNIPKPASKQCLVRVQQSRFGGGLTPGSLQFDLTEHTSTVSNIRWSPDGTKVITTSSDKTSKIWSASTGELLFTLTGHFDRVFDAAWSPDGSKVVTVSQDYTARIWSVENGKQLHVLEGHKGWVSTVDWSPDGSKIVTAGSDRLAMIWSADNGVLLFTLSGHTDYVNEVRWSPDATRVASACWDNTTKIWDGATGLLIYTLQGHTGSVNTVRWSPDGSLIATGSNDKSAKIWDAATGTLLHTFIGNKDQWINSTVNSIGWKPDGTQVITSHMDYASRIWDVAGDTLLFTLAGHSASPNTGSSWSPDGTLIVTASSSNLYTSFSDNDAKVWDATTGKLLFTLVGHTRYLKSVNWSPDGSQLATSSDDETAKIWLIDAIPLQEDTSDQVFSIVVPQAAGKSIDMKQCLVGISKDSLIAAFTTNTGSYPCRIDSIFFNGADAAAFAVVSGIPKYELPVGASKTTEFRFIPNRTGIHSATIHIYTQSDTLQESIIGEGIVPAVSILSNFIDFGQVPLGSKKDTIKAVTIKNNRAVPLTITSTRHAGPNDVDFRTLAGGGSFVLAPFDTAKLDLEYVPASEGRTSGQLLFEYNDFGSPARVQLFGEGVPLRTTITAEDITAQAGENVQLTLKLQKQTGMQLTGAPTKWRARVHYNSSILFNEQVSNPCYGTTDSCAIELTGIYNPNTQELVSIPCVATLGNTDHSTIVIDEFEWTNSAITTDVITIDGAIHITNVCDDGGVRLFISAKNSTSLSTRPNPAQSKLEVQYGLREPLTVTLELLTMTGQVVQTILNTQSQLTGQYTLTSDLSVLGNGVYLLRMRTNKETLTTRVDVVK